MRFLFRKKQTQRNEKRQKDRVLFRHPIKLLIPSLASGEGYVEVSCRNIGGGGILIEADRCYPAMVPCRIRIKIPNGSENIFHGVIIWTEENQKTKLWDVGISFTNLRNKDHEFLSQIIKQSA